jgi:uncharacterized protein
LFFHIRELELKAREFNVTLEPGVLEFLDPAVCRIDDDFELYYRPVAEGYGEEKVVDEGEAEMGFYEGDGVELNDVLREFVLLTLPMQRVCGEDCKGICPVCGQNRNQKECACHGASAGVRLGRFYR